MIECRISGEIAQIVGKKTLFLDVESPREFLRAVTVQFPATRQVLMDHDWALLVDGESLRPIDCLQEKTPGNCYELVPLLAGAEQGPLKIIGGIFLAVLSFGLGAAGLIGGAVKAIGVGLGATLALGGLSSILAPRPRSDENVGEEGKQSALLTGSHNLNQSGQPVPVVYGDFLTGSVRVNTSAVEKIQDDVFTELISESVVTVFDLLSEGEIEGFAEPGSKSVFFDSTPVEQGSGTNFPGVSVLLEKGAANYTLQGSVSSSFGVGVECENADGTAQSAIDGAVTRTVSTDAAASIRMTLGTDALYSINSTTGSLDPTEVEYSVEVLSGSAAGWVTASAGLSSPFDPMVYRVNPAPHFPSILGSANTTGSTTNNFTGSPPWGPWDLTGTATSLGTISTDTSEILGLNVGLQWTYEYTINGANNRGDSAIYPSQFPAEGSTFEIEIGVRLHGTSGSIAFQSIFAEVEQDEFETSVFGSPLVQKNLIANMEVQTIDYGPLGSFNGYLCAPGPGVDFFGLTPGQYDVYVKFSAQAANTGLQFARPRCRTATGLVSGRALGPYLWDIQLKNLSQYGTPPYSVRLLRSDVVSDPDEVRDKITWVRYQQVLEDEFLIENAAIAQTSFSAESTGGKMPKIQYRVKGVKLLLPSNLNPVTREYSGAWDGSFQAARAWYDNPAWVLYDFLRSDRYGLGLSESQVDKWSIYDAAVWCDELVSDGAGGTEPRARFDHAFTQREPALQIIQTIAATMQGTIWWGGGKVFLSVDKPADPARIFTNANVLEGTFSYGSVGLSTRSSAAMVTYRDRSNNFENAVDAMDRPHMIDRFGRNQTEVAALGVTRWSQARRAARYELLTDELEAETVTFAVGFADALIEPGQILEIRDELRNRARQGGRTQSASNHFFVLDSDLVL
ncbi:MAG: hypothetical protein CMQ40_12785 [Gammaproteobacteria bacterium]|nr:hypothetical protein [Gammaproteobacteria bacterium]